MPNLPPWAKRVYTLIKVHIRAFEANVKLDYPNATYDPDNPANNADPRKPASSARPSYARKAPGERQRAYRELVWDLELSNRTGKARQPHDPEPSQSFDIIGVALRGDGVR
jgi:hypothetical protein